MSYGIMVLPWVAVRDPRSKPFARPGPAPAPGQTHIRSLRGAAAPLSRLRRVRAQEDETILFRSAYPSHSRVRFVHLDPPGLIRPREMRGKGAAPCSGGLEDDPLHQN